MILDAWHLPGLDDADIQGWDTTEFDGGRVTLRFPVLRSSALTRLADRLAHARTATLAHRSTADIIQSIDAAAARLAHAADPLRCLALEVLPAITGYSAPMLELVLDRAVEDWRAPALEALIRSELPHPEALDRFVYLEQLGTAVRAYGPRLAFHSFSGNVPGVAVTSIVRSLLVKAATLGKTASGEPLLPVLFARALAETSPQLGHCLAVTYWRGGSELDAEAARTAETVIAYGGRGALVSIASRVPPGVRLVEHGPRIAFGLIGRYALEDEPTALATANEAAHATAIFDQHGCISPHLLYVEDGARISPQQFARFLADAFDRLATTLPRGAITPAEATAIHDARASAEFRAIAGENVELHTSHDTAWTVIFDHRPRFEPSCLNRLLLVKPVSRLEDAILLISPFRSLLQTVAIAGAGPVLTELAAALGAIGVTRITSFGAMPWPPSTWHHDGRGPLTELLRWVDLELSA